MKTVRLTAAQACIRYLANQLVEHGGQEIPYFAGAWAIFGHGNVAGLGEALAGAENSFPTFRAHNEQAMAHAAIAYAKQMRRQRAMVCTSSIGPGATTLEVMPREPSSRAREREKPISPALAAA